MRVGEPDLPIPEETEEDLSGTWSSVFPGSESLVNVSLWSRGAPHGPWPGRTLEEDFPSSHPLLPSEACDSLD